MGAAIARQTQTFIFYNVHKNHIVTDALEAACVEHGFIIVHCPRKDRRDNVDAHMKRFLRGVLLPYTDDIPIVICSGDHTFIEEVRIVGQTHDVYLGTPKEGTAWQLRTCKVQGRATFTALPLAQEALRTPPRRPTPLSRPEFLGPRFRPDETDYGFDAGDTRWKSRRRG